MSEPGAKVPEDGFERIDLARREAPAKDVLRLQFDQPNTRGGRPAICMPFIDFPRDGDVLSLILNHMEEHGVPGGVWRIRLKGKNGKDLASTTELLVLKAPTPPPAPPEPPQPHYERQPNPVQESVSGAKQYQKLAGELREVKLALEGECPRGCGEPRSMCRCICKGGCEELRSECRCCADCSKTPCACVCEECSKLLESTDPELKCACDAPPSKTEAFLGELFQSESGGKLVDVVIDVMGALRKRIQYGPRPMKIRTPRAPNPEPPRIVGGSSTAPEKKAS